MKFEFLSVVKGNLQQYLKYIDSAILSTMVVRVSINNSYLKKYFVLFAAGLFLSLSACGSYIDASLEEINKSIIPTQAVNLKNPEFFIGEVVTTTNGSVVKGIFGETSERKVLSNNVVIEGAFYE